MKSPLTFNHMELLSDLWSTDFKTDLSSGPTCPSESKAAIEAVTELHGDVDLLICKNKQVTHTHTHTHTKEGLCYLLYGGISGQIAVT